MRFHGSGRRFFWYEHGFASRGAKRIDCVDELPAGLLVAGRVGDILLDNERVSVVIRASGEGHTFPGTGPGGIVDAAPAGGEDLVREIQTFVEFNTVHADEIIISESGDDRSATVVIRGPIRVLPLAQAAIGAVEVNPAVGGSGRVVVRVVDSRESPR